MTKSPTKAPTKTPADGRQRNLLIVGIVVFVLAIVASAAIIYQSGRDTTGDKALHPKSAAGSYSLAVGEKSASVKVVVYEDFQCPFCREFEMGSRDFLQADAAAGKVYVEYRPIAFLNDYSVRTLNLFAAVLDHKGPAAALRLHDLLFDHQPSEQGPFPTDAELLSLAGKAGADSPAIKEAMARGTFKQWILNANDVASKAKVQGTPSVYVDGKLVDATSIDAMVTKLQDLVNKG